MRILIIKEANIPVAEQTRNAEISFSAKIAFALVMPADPQTGHKPSCEDGLSMSNAALFDVYDAGPGWHSGMREDLHR